MNIRLTSARFNAAILPAVLAVLTVVGFDASTAYAQTTALLEHVNIPGSGVVTLTSQERCFIDGINTARSEELDAAPLPVDDVLQTFTHDAAVDLAADPQFETTPFPDVIDATWESVATTSGTGPNCEAMLNVLFGAESQRSMLLSRDWDAIAVGATLGTDQNTYVVVGFVAYRSAPQSIETTLNPDTDTLASPPTDDAVTAQNVSGSQVSVLLSFLATSTSLRCTPCRLGLLEHPTMVVEIWSSDPPIVRIEVAHGLYIT